MQSRTRLPITIIIAIILAIAYQYYTANTFFPTLIYNPPNKNMDTTPDSGQNLARFEEISRILSMSDRGESALQLIETYRINLRFEPGNGSRFLPHSNEIVINSKAGRFSAALTLVHEATHARYYHEGMAADIKLLSRQAYTEMKMEEELMAVMNRIEATEELSENGVVVSNLPHVLYYPYRQAYGSAVRAVKNDDPGLDEDTLQNIGCTAGRTAVQQALLQGQVLTSNTQQSYPEYWGSMWDKNRTG